MSPEAQDPIRRAAELINRSSSPEPLERRLKHDIIESIRRVKPAIVADVDFEADVMTGQFFESLTAPLQGIAIAKCEGALAFYNRVGWRDAFLTTDLATCVPVDALTPLVERYHANTLHDLAYVHPKHFEKMMGKADAASLWESLKRFSQSQG